MWAITSALTVLVLLASLLATVSIGVWASQYQLESALSEAVPCGDEHMERKLREIMHKALDQALQDHIEKTFEVWMRDQTQQPARALQGVRQGVNAYIQAHRGVSKWKLLPC